MSLIEKFLLKKESTKHLAFHTSDITGIDSGASLPDVDFTAETTTILRDNSIDCVRGEAMAKLLRKTLKFKGSDWGSAPNSQRKPKER